MVAGQPAGARRKPEEAATSDDPYGIDIHR